MEGFKRDYSDLRSHMEQAEAVVKGILLVLGLNYTY
jgi:hypothetical protein